MGSKGHYRHQGQGSQWRRFALHDTQYSSSRGADCVWAEVGQKLGRSWAEAGQQLGRSWAEAGQELIQQSLPSLASPNGGTLKLAYQDCGASHGKVTGLSPNTLTLGQKTTVTGSGNVDEEVTDGTFQMTVKASILSKTCTGNICQPSTCPLPAGVGSITWNGMKCPLAKGDVAVGTDVILSGALPPWAARATIGIKGKASNGDDLLCMTLSTAPAEAPIVIQQSHPSLALPKLDSAHVEGGRLALRYEDCGDADSHVKITGLSPSTLTIGRKTTITGTGVVDEDVVGGTFEAHMGLSKGLVLLDCSGDAAHKKTCHFPFRSGSLTYAGVRFPLKPGLQQISVDLWLSPILPPPLILTKTQMTATSYSGEKIFCINVFTGRSSDESNGEVSLSYENCDESSTHVKVTTLTPKFAKVGRKTRITGSGMLDSEMSGGTFQAKTSFTGGELVSCSGDAGKSTTCGMHPFGALTFDGMQFPVKKGSSSVSMDLSLSSIIPASLANTETKVTATASNGDKLFCMKVFSTPAGSAEVVV